MSKYFSYSSLHSNQVVSITTTILIFLFAIIADANAQIGDFNGDGKSDHSVAITYRRQGKSAWLTRPSDGSAQLFWTWNVPGDAYVSGVFFTGVNKSFPGLIWVRNASLPLEWYIKNPQGGDVVLKYGKPGDIITNLGDVDCDGITDFTVVRAGSDGFLRWLTALSGSGGQVREVLFGQNSDKPFFSDTDGDGCSNYVVLRPSTYQWFTRTLNNNVFTQVQWGLPASKDIALLPRDLDGDHLPDYVISRLTGAGQIAYIRYGNGTSGTIQLGSDTSIPQIGNFTGTLGFSWWQRDTGLNAIRNLNASLEFFKLGIPSNFLIRSDGSVVNSSDDGRFGTSTNSPKPPTTPNNPTDPGSPPTNPGLASVCPSVRDFRDGEIWKSIASTHIPDSDPRRFSSSFITSGGVTPPSDGNCVEAYDSNGNKVHSLGRYYPNGPYSARYYGGFGCGDSKTAGKVAAEAQKNSGKTAIYLKYNSSQCLRVSNPNSCINSSGC